MTKAKDKASQVSSDEKDINDLPQEVLDPQMQDICSSLPEEKRKFLIRRVKSLTLAKSHCGPIPIPIAIISAIRIVGQASDSVPVHTQDRTANGYLAFSY